MRREEEINSTKRASNNNYMNTDLSASNITAIPAGMCIPDCGSSDVAAASIDSARVDQESASDLHDTCAQACPADAEACSENMMIKPSLPPSAVDEVDSVSADQDQEITTMKYEQEHVPADSSSVSRSMSKVCEMKMPEYMNLAINMDHDGVHVLGAIPKKLPAPPVPPRGMTSYVNFYV